MEKTAPNDGIKNNRIHSKQLHVCINKAGQSLLIVSCPTFIPSQGHSIENDTCNHTKCSMFNMFGRIRERSKVETL